MRTKITFLLIFSLFFSLTSEAKSEIQASDARIHYCGRIQKDNGNVSFDWSGVRTTIEFYGTNLSLNYSDTKCNWLNVWVDRVPDEKSDIIMILGGNEVTLAANLKEGQHRVIIEKRTEGEQGKLTYHSFVTDGRFLQAKKSTDRLIEFIGDSYTCGYGTESKSKRERFSPSTENCNLTYAAILARTFDCETRLISHSGRGVVRNYDGYDKDLPMCDKYPQTFDGEVEPKWTPSTDETNPQLVVIYLGTNDFSCGKHPSVDQWCIGYDRIIDQVKEYYGEEIPILCVAPCADDKLLDYVREAVKRSNHTNLHPVAIFDQHNNSDSDRGADDHPNYKGHQKVALCLMPYISTLTGWKLPELIN